MLVQGRHDLQQPLDEMGDGRGRPLGVILQVEHHVEDRARGIDVGTSQDPALKARRLARALISDMVVYHPAKRQEGLRDGNLKDLFEDEIRKSWEEYSDQVGKDVADSTPYFKEALNEILAGGRQLF